MLTELCESDTLIRRSPFLDQRPPLPRRRFVIGSCVAALLVHLYALAVLPAALDVAVEEDTNLMNDELGNDPDLPINYNIDRIEEVSVPGPINSDDTVWVLNAPDGPPMTLPPPPGWPDLEHQPQGGGIDVEPTTIERGFLTR
jgi:hypothetical protein